MRAVVLALVLALAAAPLAAAAGRLVEVKYAGSADLGVCSLDPTPGRAALSGRGSVCVDVLQGETTVRVALADATGRPPVFQAAAFRADEVKLAERLSCAGAPVDLAVGGARYVLVYLFEPALAYSKCAQPTVATVGTATFTFG